MNDRVAPDGNSARTAFPPPTFFEKVEAWLSRTSMKSNLLQKAFSYIWLPYAFRSGLTTGHGTLGAAHVEGVHGLRAGCGLADATDPTGEAGWFGIERCEERRSRNDHGAVAVAIATRCFIPPLNSWGNIWATLGFKPTCSRRKRTRSRYSLLVI